MQETPNQQRGGGRSPDWDGTILLSSSHLNPHHSVIFCWTAIFNWCPVPAQWSNLSLQCILSVYPKHTPGKMTLILFFVCGCYPAFWILHFFFKGMNITPSAGFQNIWLLLIWSSSMNVAVIAPLLFLHPECFMSRFFSPQFTQFRIRLCPGNFHVYTFVGGRWWDENKDRWMWSVYSSGVLGAATADQTAEL